MSATVWLPQPAGQPDQWMRTGLRLSTRASRERATARARAFVSMTARLQNSMPVQLTSPRMISDGSMRSTLSSGSTVRFPSVASGTLGTMTF